MCPRNSHGRGTRGRLFNSGKIKPRAASPSRGRSTRVAQDRGAVRTATNPDCVAPSTRRRPRRFRARRSRRCGAPWAYLRTRGDDDETSDSPLRTVSSDRRLEINHRMEWEPAPGEPARLICRKAQLFSKSLLELLHRKNLLGTECPLLAQSGHPELHRTCPLSGVKRT